MSAILSTKIIVTDSTTGEILCQAASTTTALPAHREGTLQDQVDVAAAALDSQVEAVKTDALEQLQQLRALLPTDA